MNKRIIYMLTFFSALFLGLIGYLTYTTMTNTDEYVQSSYNTRNSAQEAKIRRGTIYDRNGVELAYSEADKNGRYHRVYPYDNLYSHVIGYSSSQYGKSLLEKKQNQPLLGKSDMAQIFSLERLFDNAITEGNDLTLTIDHKLQQKARSLMKNYRGALVAMNPKTGEILAMVSMPDFNPNSEALEKNWSELNTDDNSPFLTRATMGLYPPGSTYKVVTSAIILESGLEDEYVRDDSGNISIGSRNISNSGGSAYGDTNLLKGFIKSSNVYFASMGADIDDKIHKDMAERFLFNSKTGIDFPYSVSKFDTGSMGALDCAVASIGQGKTLVTPLHLALVCSTIANGGSMPKPYIVSDVIKKGNVISSARPSMLANPINLSTANAIKDMMLETVESGTGTRAAISGIDVCGKTGTAENENSINDESKTHATFIGFAPYDNPEIAVSVILEQAGFGGSVAAPIARDVMKEYFYN